MVSRRLLLAFFQLAPIPIAMLGMFALSSIALYNNDYELAIFASFFAGICGVLYVPIIGVLDYDDDDDDDDDDDRRRRRRLERRRRHLG